MEIRIKQILEKEGLTAGEFAKQVGIQPGAVSHLLSGRNKPSLDVVQKILNTFRDINPDWFLFGTGSMSRGEKYMEKAPVQTILFPIDNAEKTDDSLENTDEQRVSENFDTSSTPPESKKTDLPIFDWKKTTPHELKKVIIFYSDGTFEEITN